MASQPKWFLGLYNSTGTLLADLSIASNRNITYQLNAPSVCSFQIPLTHASAAAIVPGSTYVKAYREDTAGTRTLRFYGPIWVDEINTGSGVDMLNVTAQDPLAYLGRRYTSAAFTATDRGAIIKTCIDTTNNDNETGISTTLGTITTSSTITADYSSEKPSILDLAGQYTDATDGIDFAIIPQELSTSKIGYLNVYARRGSSKPNAVFAYGSGTLDNSTIKRTRNVDNLTTYVSALEGDATSVWTDTNAVSTYRRLDSIISLSNDTNLASMSARTRRYLDTHSTPDLIAEYAITPGPRAPRIFDDFDIGDTVPVHLRRAIEFVVQQRVYSATIAISENGVETISALDTRSV